MIYVLNKIKKINDNKIKAKKSKIIYTIKYFLI